MMEQHVDARATSTAKSRVERRLYQVTKRIFDLLSSVMFLVLTAPLMLLIAILVKLDSPGPIVVGQVRIGRWGVPFTLYRFRTMRLGAEELPIELEEAILKIKHDPRLTRLGRMLRSTALDELPQLFSVVKGEMSLVGPRPALPYELELQDELDSVRLRIRPGLVGLSQVAMTKYGHDREGMWQADLEYFENASLWMDLKILAQTVMVVLQGKGAY